MKTKLQLSKNVTMNKPDEKRQGMKVRTVVTGHAPRVGLFLCETRKSMGRPSLALESSPSSGMPMSRNLPERGEQSGGARYISTRRWHPLIIGTYLPGA